MYTATITTGATDAIGTALAKQFCVEFHNRNHSHGDFHQSRSTARLNIPINRKITATFSEAMNPATVTAAGVFSLTVTTGGAVVPGAVTFVTANNTSIFSPTANLLPNTQLYRHHQHCSAERSRQWPGSKIRFWFYDRRGRGRDCADHYFHRTGLRQPINVPTNQIITATFSKPMDPSTITATGTFTVAVAGVGGAAVAGTVSYTGNHSYIQTNRQFGRQYAVHRKNHHCRKRSKRKCPGRRCSS